MLHSIERFLIGKPLKSQSAGEQKLTKLKTLAYDSAQPISLPAESPAVLEKRYHRRYIALSF
ncbi:hypothetical protein B4144_0472 [Bacillus atrophaeus]|nr:hypothetical protein B4144_0472 [Bacillus atrophaeus]